MAMTKQKYKNALSKVASTTGNYTGIYDMSGGAWEYVMGVRGNTNAGSSGLGTNIESKYYDIYNTNSDETTFQYRILGDGTAEFGPFGSVTYASQTRKIGSWYNDAALFVYSTEPWFIRGGHHSNGFSAGTFVFSRHSGATYTYDSFRLVLAV